MTRTRLVSSRRLDRRRFLRALAGTLLVTSTASDARAQSDPYPLAVDLAWLADRATGADLRVFDVSPLHVWRDGHIDSAEHAWWRDTVDPHYPVFGAVLTQGDEQRYRQEVFDSLGLLAGDNVVVYDNEEGFRAARLVWFLRFLGFQRAALLTEGYTDWKRTPFTIDSASTTSTTPRVDPQEGFYLVTEQVASRLGRTDAQIVDIRTDNERAETLDGMMPAGQIPGSIRFPWVELMDDSGRLRDAQQVFAHAQTLGLEAEREIIIYGSFGVDTALSWLVLSRAGFPTVLTYDRGWAEWSALPDLPREPIV
ncbi:MAG: hypothetical protein KC438_03710 [Thermomicrobiales bacterium]|nr:hypothetical protein [Thermomicrobiales bacterium]MCO5220081.1 rhodanese-like domain-containing protein [Thermomicrobiales bacterium]